MSSPKVLIILGAGSNTGAKVAEKFIEKGYKALLVSRSGTTVKGGFSIELDLSDPESVGIAFKTCIKEFGSAPNIVIFNGNSKTPRLGEQSERSLLTVFSRCISHSVAGTFAR